MCIKLFHVPTERNQHNRVYQIISCFSNCNSLMRTVLLLTSHIHWQQLYSFLIHVSWIFHLSHPLNQLWSGYNHYFCDNFDVNGNQTNLDTSWPENEEAVQLFLSAYFIILSFQYLYKRSTFLLWIWTLPGTTMLVYSPYQQEQKKLGFWGTWYFCYTQSILVYDVTDTDCWAQNGSTHGHHFKTFKCSETELKTAVRNFSTPFLWTEPIKVFHFSSLSNQRLDFNPTASYLGHWQRHHAGKPGHWWQSDRGPAAHPSLWG